MAEFNPALFAASVGAHMMSGCNFGEALYNAGCDHADDLEAWETHLSGIVDNTGDYAIAPSDDMRKFFDLSPTEPTEQTNEA